MFLVEKRSALDVYGYYLRRNIHFGRSHVILLEAGSPVCPVGKNSTQAMLFLSSSYITFVMDLNLYSVNKSS